MAIRKKNRIPVIPFLMTVLLLGCRETPVPKPKGYFRIDMPEHTYVSFNPDLTATLRIPVTFEYPEYGKISSDPASQSMPGWFNLDFPAYNARIYLTYKNVNKDLEKLMDQTYTMNVKNHITKADAINEQVISDTTRKVYGILYDLKGSTATAVQFFVTDSTKHFLRGSLYFEAEPNPDSLAPVIDFFRTDIIHMIETLHWIDR